MIPLNVFLAPTLTQICFVAVNLFTDAILCVGGLLYAGWAYKLPKYLTGIPHLGDLMVSPRLLSFLQRAQGKNVHHQTGTF